MRANHKIQFVTVGIKIVDLDGELQFTCTIFDQAILMPMILMPTICGILQDGDVKNHNISEQRNQIEMYLLI